jgi:hypothetical protein
LLSGVDVKGTLLGFFHHAPLVEEVSDVLGVLVGSLHLLAGIDGPHQSQALLVRAVILAAEGSLASFGILGYEVEKD